MWICSICYKYTLIRHKLYEKNYLKIENLYKPVNIKKKKKTTLLNTC